MAIIEAIFRGLGVIAMFAGMWWGVACLHDWDMRRQQQKMKK